MEIGVKGQIYFFGKKYEIWVNFGSVGNTEKKSFGPIMSNF